MQTQTTLSTTEAEYNALSVILREQISILELLKEVATIGVDVKFNCQPSTVKHLMITAAT